MLSSRVISEPSNQSETRRVSGIQIHVDAPSTRPIARSANAVPKPFVSASEPITNGDTALPIRPTLYVNPVAVARIAVGYSSPVTAPKPEKNPVAKNVVTGASTASNHTLRVAEKAR